MQYGNMPVESRGPEPEVPRLAFQLDEKRVAASARSDQPELDVGQGHRRRGRARSFETWELIHLSPAGQSKEAQPSHGSP